MTAAQPWSYDRTQPSARAAESALVETRFLIDSPPGDGAGRFGAGSMSPIVERIRSSLLADLSEPLSLKELARRVRMSREQCVRAFSKRFGMPPCRFRMYARVERASLLLAGGMRPTNVAFECGFTDQSHLNRWFRKVMGVTPGQFARSAHGPTNAPPRAALPSVARSKIDHPRTPVQVGSGRAR